MITRSQSGIVKPIDRLSLHTSSISRIPKNPSHALKDPNWRNAMYDELMRWLKWHLARLVANGSSQQLRVDFGETFSSVVKPATIRTVLSLVVSRKWPIHQLDVKNAFLNGDLSETVYMHQPPGFVDSRYPHRGSQVAYLLIYVNDIILTASCPVLLQQIIGSLNNEFDMTDLGMLNYFLGISVDHTPTVGYTDADWAGSPSARSFEAEYQCVANVVAETAWIRNFLRELHSSLSTATLVYCDNCAISSPKDFPGLFEDFHSSLSIRLPPAQTAKAYKSI
nr:ribonuclease H-like domain-containing protein [Tanacetum cinerariifolium]